MMVFDPTVAAEYKNVEAEIERVMKRAEAQVIVSRKWDERKLAYEIEGRKRGCYVLTYFRANPSKIAAIQRDFELSESILRGLVLSAEGLTEEQMLRSVPVPAERSERPEEEHGRDRDRDRDRDRERRPRHDRERRGGGEPKAAPAEETAVAVAEDGAEIG
jgi:small subunit ribosomal protein S6